MLNNRQKSVIHVAKAKVGMSDEDYRALLSSFGVASCSNLDAKDFRMLMTHFEKMGFKSTFSKQPKPKESKKRLAAKVNAIRVALGLSEGYLDAMARRMFNVDSYRWLSEDQLHRLVAALTYHQRKKEAS